MSGLIWSALGQAVGNAATNIGNYVARDAEREDRQEERRREREEDIRRQTERDATYRRTADQQGAGRGGSSGPRELTDDEQSAMAGMTRPEYDAYWGSVKTGDKSGFKREQQKISTTETGDPYNPEMTSVTARDYPPGFEAEYQAKVAKLAEIRKMSVYNKDYDDVKKGERTGQEIDASRRADAEPAKAGVIGQAIAAGKGNDLVGGDSNVTRNKFTGATSTTEVGQSAISENRAKAEQAAAAGRLSDSKAAGGDPDAVNAKTADLQRKVTAARASLAMEMGIADNDVNAELRSLRRRKDGEETLNKLKPLIDRYKASLDAMDSWGPGKSKPKESDAPAPRAAPRPASAASGSRPPLSSFSR